VLAHLLLCSGETECLPFGYKSRCQNKRTLDLVWLLFGTAFPATAVLKFYFGHIKVNVERVPDLMEGQSTRRVEETSQH
jgi:hypothetical protein